MVSAPSDFLGGRLETKRTSVSAKAGLSATLRITDLTTGITTSFTINEGDTVYGLRYTTTGGATETVSGIVKAINYTSTSKNSQTNNGATCGICGSWTSQFADVTKISSFVVDCSSKYGAKVITVPVNSIISIDQVNVSSLDVENIEITSYNTLKFQSNSMPDTVMWNREIADIEVDKTDVRKDGISTYIVHLPTMERENDLRIFSQDSFFSTMVNGIEPDIDRTECIENGILAATTRLKEYVSLPSSDDTPFTIDDSDLYVIVASDVGETDSIQINGQTFGKDELYDIEIGNNVFSAPVYKVSEGLLMLNIAIVPFFVQPGAGTTVHISFGGFEFDAPMIVESEKVLSVSAVSSGGKEGYETRIETSTTEDGTLFTHYRQDGSAFLTVTVSSDKIPVEATECIFMRSEKLNDDTTTLTEDAESDEVRAYKFKINTLASLSALYNSNFKGPFIDESQLDSGMIEYKIFIPSEGMLNFAVDTHESIKKTEVGDKESLVSALADLKSSYLVLTNDIDIPNGLSTTASNKTIDGNGRKITASEVSDGQAGLLIGENSKNVIVKNLSVEATGDYAVKVYCADDVILDNITAVSHTKGAIQLNSSDVILKGHLSVSGEWGGIEICKSAERDMPHVVVESGDIESDKPLLPTVWIDKVAEDNLYTALVDKAAALSPMDRVGDAISKDQSWYK